MENLHRHDIPLGGFAGVREHRLVMDPRAFGEHAHPGAWPGVGNFVYLSDARFVPQGETKMHNHQGIDVISVMVEGRISHEGSLEDGQEVSANQVQVQHAGGDAGQDETFPGHTLIDVSLLVPGQNVTVDGQFVAYLTRGRGTANEESVSEGDLIRGDRLAFDASEDGLLIVMHTLGGRAFCFAEIDGRACLLLTCFCSFLGQRLYGHWRAGLPDILSSSWRLGFLKWAKTDLP